ncbi:transposase family protein [Streptomyces sp. 3211]|uniref:transposase family protein n=1 Tax=Streptomyces sp. 3211 TaxID=1964449 RepID=UPI0009A4C0A3|nr:transposase family protein [Streptomyces sp. 3211]
MLVSPRSDPHPADTSYIRHTATISSRQPLRQDDFKVSNRSHARIRALVEQAIATLKAWRLLRKLRCSTTRITSLVQAVLTLHLASSD